MERVEELLRKTKNKMRVEDEMGECFWTAREVRQRCPPIPLMFNLLVPDLEEEMGRVKL